MLIAVAKYSELFMHCSHNKKNNTFLKCRYINALHHHGGKGEERQKPTSLRSVSSLFYSSLFSFQLLIGSYQNVITHPGYCLAGCCALQHQKLFGYILLLSRVILGIPGQHSQVKHCQQKQFTGA